MNHQPCLIIISVLYTNQQMDTNQPAQNLSYMWLLGNQTNHQAINFDCSKLNQTSGHVQGCYSTESFQKLKFNNRKAENSQIYFLVQIMSYKLSFLLKNTTSKDFKSLRCIHAYLELISIFFIKGFVFFKNWLQI